VREFGLSKKFFSNIAFFVKQLPYLYSVLPKYFTKCKKKV